MVSSIVDGIYGLYGRFLAEGGKGVHITYEQLYAAIVFLAAIFAAGFVASRLFRMPALVGEIIIGIVLGPPLLKFVPMSESWVMFGEIGYVTYTFQNFHSKMVALLQENEQYSIRSAAAFVCLSIYPQNNQTELNVRFNPHIYFFSLLHSI